MKKIFISLAVFASLIMPLFFLDAETTCESGKLCNPIKYDTFSELVAAITKTAVEVLLPFVVLSFVYTGFIYVQAQGNPTKIGKAHEAFLYSVIGALVLFGAWGLAGIIETTMKTFTTTTATS